MSKYGTWEAAYHCAGCGEEMSNDARMYSGGICPVCGDCAAGSVVKCVKRIRRKVFKSRKGRREAIEATRARNSVSSFLWYEVVLLFRAIIPKRKQKFTWEYKKDAA